MATKQQRDIARRFMETVPALLHSMGSELRVSEADEGPVTIAQFRAMAVLHGHAHTLNELAARHEVSPPTMSRLISTLVERGWVQREPDPGDRRQVILTLTPHGLGRWGAMVTRGTDHLAEWLAELSDDECAALEVALTGLARVLAARRAGAEEPRGRGNGNSK